MQTRRAIFTTTTSREFGEDIRVEIRTHRDRDGDAFNVLQIGPCDIHADASLIRRIHEATGRFIAETAIPAAEAPAVAGVIAV